MHTDSLENASVFFTFSSHVDSHESVIFVFSHASDNFGWQNDVDLFFLSWVDVGRMPFNDTNTFSFVFEGDDSVSKFSRLSPENDFVMVEDRFLKEGPSCSSDVNLGSVFNIRMEDEFR